MKRCNKRPFNNNQFSEESKDGLEKECWPAKNAKKIDYYKSDSQYGADSERNAQRSEDKNSHIQESIVYFERILKELKRGLHEESKDIFSQNVLKESESKEVELCCHNISSHCIEALLPVCNDQAVLERFLAVFAQNKETVCTDSNASHITELLIHMALKNVKNWGPDFFSDSETPESKITMTSISWLTDFADFICENFSSCLSNTYSCHVTCTLVRALGGDLSEQRTFMSKKSRNHKQQFRQSYVDDSNSEKSQFYEPVVLDEIPKFFIKALKRMAKAFMGLPDITDCVTDSSAATVIEALLAILKKRVPKRNKKFIISIASRIFEDKDENGIPHAFLHKNSSYIVEEMFRAANEKVQDLLWQQYMAGCLDKLVVHPVGNYIVQRLFDVVESVQHFETMFQSIINLFDEILKCKHYGIFVSSANTCIRLKVQQAQFMKSMMQCLQCYQPEERQVQLIPLLLGFKTFEQYSDSRNSENIPVCLQGSLVAQAVLKFHKPIKAVNSVLNMKPADLANLAKHFQGCHVLNSYFDASNNVGEKNKDKLMNHMKPVLLSLICDRSGSLTLCRIWTLLSIKQKEIIMRELVAKEKTLLKDRNGSIIIKKFGTFYWKTHYDEWKQIQNNLSSSKNHA